MKKILLNVTEGKKIKAPSIARRPGDTALIRDQRDEFIGIEYFDGLYENFNREQASKCMVEVFDE